MSSLQLCSETPIPALAAECKALWGWGWGAVRREEQKGRQWGNEGKKAHRHRGIEAERRIGIQKETRGEAG